MAKQTINVGTTANDGTGDTLRVSQQKTNSNFTELYDAIASGVGTLQEVVTAGRTYVGTAATVTFNEDGTFTIINNTTGEIIYFDAFGQIISANDSDGSVASAGIYWQNGFFAFDNSTSKSIFVGRNLDNSGFIGIQTQRPTEPAGGIINNYYSLGDRPAGYYDLATLDDIASQSLNDVTIIGNVSTAPLIVRNEGVDSLQMTERQIIRDFITGGGSTTIGFASTSEAININVKAESGTLALLSDIPSTSVSSVNSKTGTVILNTDDIAEVVSPTNKWFTNARTIASVLTGFTSGSGTVSSSDTILQAIQKIVGNIAGKQDALGYTAENTANKSTSTSDSASTTKFPVWSAILSYFDASRIRTILGISTLSGSNTGDQDLSGLALKSDYMVLSSAYVLSNTTSLQKMFNVGSGSTGAFNTTANKTYKFRLEFDMTGLSTTSSYISFGFLGTAVISSLSYKANAAKQGLNSNAAPFLTSIQVATISQITTATTTATAKGIITGVIRCTTAGTLIPAIATSIGVSTAQVEANSFFEITEIGSNTITATSNIS